MPWISMPSVSMPSVSIPWFRCPRFRCPRFRYLGFDALGLDALGFDSLGFESQPALPSRKARTRRESARFLRARQGHHALSRLLRARQGNRALSRLLRARQGNRALSRHLRARQGNRAPHVTGPSRAEKSVLARFLRVPQGKMRACALPSGAARETRTALARVLPVRQGKRVLARFLRVRQGKCASRLRGSFWCGKGCANTTDGFAPRHKPLPPPLHDGLQGVPHLLRTGGSNHIAQIHVLHDNVPRAMRRLLV